MKQTILALTINVIFIVAPCKNDTTRKVIDKPGVYWPADRDTSINWNKTKRYERNEI